MARPSTGANLNIVELQRILGDRKKQLEKLHRKRDTIQRSLNEIDAEIAKVSGGAAGESTGGRATGKGSRARNDRPLPDYMEEVMVKAGRPMKVNEIVEAVLAAGYKTTSASFKNIINQQLIKERKRFQHTDRGTYAAAGKK